MRRAWTVKDIKGLIERYTPKTPKTYVIYFELRTSGLIDDNRYLMSSSEVVNQETYESFMAMLGQASASANPIPVLANWLANHSTIRFRCTGLLQKGNSFVPQVVFASETGNEVMIGGVDSNDYVSETASLYFDSIYGDGRVL